MRVKLSPNFYRDEFQCSCCDLDTVDAELIYVLQDVRDFFDKPITINSACRCLPYNRSVGSNDASQHPKCKAADIVVKDIPPYLVHEYLTETYPEKYGIGEYDDFTHIDVRAIKGRW